MSSSTQPYSLLRNVLDRGDIAFLRDRCRERLDNDGVPCFALLDHMASPTYAKIERALTASVGEPLHYLNDFYLYTDATFKTSWHMDTELFTFENAVNAWILLSPDEVENPLGFIPDLNDEPERHFHSVRIKGDECTFRNFRTGKGTVRSLQSIEESQVRTPVVRVGDILAIDPRLFHRTNVSTPKHAFGMKFVWGKRKGCVSPTQVPDKFWPEVKTFNDIIDRSSTWDDVVDHVRAELKTELGRERLSSGFYPEKFDLYKRMIHTL